MMKPEQYRSIFILLILFIFTYQAGINNGIEFKITKNNSTLTSTHILDQGQFPTHKGQRSTILLRARKCI